MEISPEEIEKNWKKYLSLLSTKLGDRSDAAVHMAESLGERLALCPASSRLSYHNCYVGGLVEHSLRVLGNVINLSSTMGWNLPKDSLVLSALFHDIGKVGDENESYYLPQKDKWKAEKNGELYMINSSMQYMTVPDRGVYLCQHFGLKLTKDEFLAIKLNDGQYIEENAPYKLKEPTLAVAVHMADLLATREEKGLDKD
jgi:hypothetical protein